MQAFTKWFGAVLVLLGTVAVYTASSATEQAPLWVIVVMALCGIGMLYGGSNFYRNAYARVRVSGRKK